MSEMQMHSWVEEVHLSSGEQGRQAAYLQLKWEQFAVELLNSFLSNALKCL
jgi:hypothetical protein